MTFFFCCFSVVGWRISCWQGENWRNFSHTEETQSFPQVRAVHSEVWAHSLLPVISIYWLYISVSLHMPLAVTTSSDGTCLSCCLLSCQRRAAREEHRLRYQHWKPSVFEIKPGQVLCIHCLSIRSVLSLSLVHFCLKVLLEVLQCLCYAMLWSLSTSSETLTSRVSDCAFQPARVYRFRKRTRRCSHIVGFLCAIIDELNKTFEHITEGFGANVWLCSQLLDQSIKSSVDL